jgi:hypothetical protein
LGETGAVSGDYSIGTGINQYSDVIGIPNSPQYLANLLRDIEPHFSLT